MNRRDALLLAAGSAATAIPSEGVAQEARLKIFIQAPLDVVVTSIAPAGAVKKGQKLFELRSFYLDHLALQLDLHEQHLDIIERPFKEEDGRVDLEIACAKRSAEKAQSMYTLATQQYRHDKNWETVGNYPPYDPRVTDEAIRAEDLDRKMQLAYAEASAAEKKKQDALDKIALGRSKLKQQKDLLEQMKQCLVITAPQDGNFIPQIAAGLSSKKGEVLAEFT
jgi:hypothetical protein